MRMAINLRPVTREKERENTAITSRATSRPKDLRRRALAGGCLQENSKIESQPRSGKCSATSQQFLRPLRRRTLTPARSIAYSTPREPGVTAFNQKPNRPPRSFWTRHAGQSGHQSDARVQVDPGGTQPRQH